MDKKKWEQENVLRLVKKSRKGLLRVVFSRFGLMALLLILELVLLWMMWRWFNNDFEWFAAVQGVFTVLMFFHLFNSDMDATGKLTWMFLLAGIPIPASIFLWFTEKDVGHRTLKRRVQQRIDESRDLLHQDPEVLRDPEIESSGTDDLCRYLNRSGSFPLYANTETKFFPQGEDKFAALLEELQKAEKFIFLEYFIIDEGYMWGSILKILADKAAQGVDVRVQTAIEMRAMAEPYIRSKAIRHMEKGRVVIFGCGTGNPFFSTDTAAVLRAAEIDADAILLAKNIDGVYSADPKKDPSAVKYDTITYDDVLAQHLQVMDSTATSLSMDNKIPVVLFALKDPENILRVVMGEKIGTIVKEEP